MHHSSDRAPSAPTVPQGFDRETPPNPLVLGLEPTPLERRPKAPSSAAKALLRLLGGSLLVAVGSCDRSVVQPAGYAGIDTGTVSQAHFEPLEAPSERPT